MAAKGEFPAVSHHPDYGLLTGRTLALAEGGTTRAGRPGFDMPSSQASRASLRPQDRRRYQRVKVNLLGRFMLEDRLEYPCQTADMSPGSVSLVTPVTGRIGERVVA